MKESLWDKRWKEGLEEGFEATSLDRCSGSCFEIIRDWIDPHPGSILEVGSGTGRFCIALAEEYPDSQVTALDLSNPALRLAEEGAKKKGLKNIIYAKGDIFNMPFGDDLFDTVFNEGVIEHFENYEDILREMIRVSKLQGKIIVAVPNWCNLIYNLTLFFSKEERARYGRIKLFRHKELNSLFKRCGLDDIKISGFDPAHAITRLSRFWPKCEWLGRKIDSFLVKPLDVVTKGGFSSRFGFEVIACGTKVRNRL